MNRIFILLLLILPIMGSAQLSISYSMGGISLESSQMSSFSGPVVINPDKGCLRVGNGVVVYAATSAGSALFNPDCKNETNTTEPIFKIFPNPAPGLTRLYSDGAIPPTEPITILVHDLKGSLVNRMQIRAGQLEAGLPIQTKQWASGMYLITIVYQNKSNSLKLINSLY
jgi:hypothetical protein